MAARYHQIKHDRREAEASDRNNPFPAAVYLRRDEGSLKHRPKGHSAGPCLMLSCDKGSALCLIAVFGMSFNLGIFSMDKGAERQQRKDIYHVKVEAGKKFGVRIFEVKLVIYSFFSLKHIIYYLLFINIYSVILYL